MAGFGQFFQAALVDNGVLVEQQHPRRLCMRQGGIIAAGKSQVLLKPNNTDVPAAPVDINGIGGGPVVDKQQFVV